MRGYRRAVHPSAERYRLVFIGMLWCSYVDTPSQYLRVPPSAPGRLSTKGAERRGFAMAAVLSNADVKKASLEVFTQSVGDAGFCI
ncbi:MAG: hypothetical protein ACLP1W_07965 [Rhodomicrobium sp.]